MSSAFAEGTIVPVERTRAEIDSLLVRHGARQSMIGSDEDKHLAMIAFVIAGARFRVDIPLPKFGDELPPPKGTGKTPPGWDKKSPEQKQTWRSKMFEQARRERWRAILLLLKAKLEAVRIGVSTVEREFLADMVLPNGATTAEVIGDAIRKGLIGSETKMLGVGS